MLRRFRRIAWLLVLVTGCRESAVDNLPRSEPTPETPAINSAGANESPEPALPIEAVSDSPASEPTSPALAAFLKKFDVLSASGFVPTLRAGSTGIGYTLETMLDIEENNSPGGDFQGMELKAFRDDDLHMDDAEKMNLFLKEPKWTDGLQGSQRVHQYGYVDDSGRPALYSTVTINKSSHDFAFRVDAAAGHVWLQFEDRDIAYWTYALLEKRLLEKHSEAVFVAAHARGEGKQEEFHYYAVTWCADPSVDAFVGLIESGDVMLELRMHVKPTGSLRNHGTAFRIKQNRIPDLYRISRQVRPLAAVGDL